MTKVLIKKGEYRNYKVENKVFELLEPFKVLPSGESVVVVTGTRQTVGKDGKVRIKVMKSDIQYLDANGKAVDDKVVAATPKAEDHISSEPDVLENFYKDQDDVQAMARIKHQFDLLEQVVDGTTQGFIRGLIISGPPGVGKSWTVKSVLDKASMMKKLTNNQENYTFIKGQTSALGLYCQLYWHRQADKVLVFDDCDSVLFDEDALNLLKSALDSGKKRTLCWNAESSRLRKDGIEDRFEFEGSVIFLTNINLNKIRSNSRVRQHLNAILSRCHYFDLEMDENRDQVLRIHQIVRDGMLTEFEFTAEQEKEVVDFVISNKDDLLEISLRSLYKVAVLRRAQPDNWRELAEHTMLKRNARYRRIALEAARNKQTLTIADMVKKDK